MSPQVDVRPLRILYFHRPRAKTLGWPIAFGVAVLGVASSPPGRKFCRRSPAPFRSAFLIASGPVHSNDEKDEATLIDQHRHIAERPPELDSNRKRSRIALKRWRDSMSSKASPDQNQHFRRNRTATRQERSIACLVELLEVRSVPSGLGQLSISGLTSVIQSTQTGLVRSVVPLFDLGEPDVLSSSNSPASALPFIDVVTTASGTVLGAVNSDLNLAGVTRSPALPIGSAVAAVSGTILDAVGSGLNLVGATPSPTLPIGSVVATATGTVLNAVNSGQILLGPSPAPVVAPIDVDLGSHVASAGNATSGVVEALLAPVVSSIHVDLGSQVDGSASDAQAVSFAAGAGSVAIQTAAPGTIAHATVSSTTGASDSATSSHFHGVGDEGAAGQGRFEDAPVIERPPFVDPLLPTGRAKTPAELLPADLESLEHALGQLMRQFDEIGVDLADWLTRIGTLEMVLATGMVGLACELIRRHKRRSHLVNPPTRFGSSNRPGPFYRRKATPFARPGSGTFASGPTIV
jgi:hypothetical protein